ncbi:MAG: hypothetical protein AB7S75_12805 [Desulfococcaceae bacterium]
MSEILVILKKMPFLCLLLIFLVLPAAEAKQKKKVRVSEGTIRVVTDIPKVKVFINGEAEGLAHPGRPLVRDHIPAGEVRIRVRAKNHPEKKKTVKLRSGKTAEVKFQFLPDDATGKTSDPKGSKRKDQPIHELLSAGDKYFRVQRYMAPEHENAFEMYKSVLAAEPKNSHAREKIYEMIEIYRKLGAENEDKNLERSFSYRMNSLKLLDFAVESMKDRNWGRERDSLKKQVKDIENRIRKADQLAKEGDSHFIAQRYTTPKNKNAFSLYKAALEKNPTHEHAKKRILEIARFYKEQTDRARQNRNKAKAARYQEHYRPVEQYISEHFGKREKESSPGSPDRSRETETLLKQGAEYVRIGQLAGDGEKNGLYIYQQVLRLDPENGTALKKIREMMKTCRANGMSAFEKEHHDQAVSWFDQYLKIGRYAAFTKKIPVPETEITEIRQLRTDTEHHLQKKELETMREVLKKNYDQYKELRTKEDGGQNVAEEILPVMREIIANLSRIEQIYEEFPEKDGDITEKIGKVRDLRMEMEKEVETREDRTD